MTELSQLYAACLVAYAAEQPGKTYQGPTIRLLEGACATFNLPFIPEYVDAAEEILEHLQIIRRYQHEGMQPFSRLKQQAFQSAFEENIFGVRMHTLGRGFDQDSLEYPVLDSYADLGDSWLEDALDTYRRDLWAEWEPLKASSNTSVPASDRIVTISHNSSEVSEIIETADRLITQLDIANDRGDINEDEKDAVKTEVRELANYFRTNKIRPKIVFERAKVTLKWISSKAAEAMVGALALTLLTLIASYLGMSL